MRRPRDAVVPVGGRSESSLKNFAVLFVIGILILAGGTADVMKWTAASHGPDFAATNHGQGFATVGTSASTIFIVSTSNAIGDAMTPGGAIDLVPFTVTNVGAGSALFSTATAVVANPAEGSTWVAVAGCSAADYIVGTPVIAYGQLASGDSISGTVSITMVNRPDDQNACQGVSVPLYFTVD